MIHADMFLKVTTTKTGVLKGESGDYDHGGEIDVIKMAWGAQAHTDLSSLGATGKASLNQLEITKRVDSASTALMNALVSNELIKEALLTVRKAGSTPLEYVKITLSNARVTRLYLESEDAELYEKLTLAYEKVNVTYTPQGPDGRGRGSMVFEARTSTDDGASDR